VAPRQSISATVEAGTVSDMARLDLGHEWMWLYPQDDGTVRVEFEDKGITPGVTATGGESR
jgi:hypothetical protein